MSFSNEPSYDTTRISGQLLHWRNEDRMVRFDPASPITNVVHKEVKQNIFGQECEVETWHPYATMIDILDGSRHRVDLYDLQIIYAPVSMEEVNNPVNYFYSNTEMTFNEDFFPLMPFKTITPKSQNINIEKPKDKLDLMADEVIKEIDKRKKNEKKEHPKK